MNLKDLNLDEETYKKIINLARIFNASKMTCEEIKLVDKQDISGILVSKEGK